MAGRPGTKWRAYRPPKNTDRCDDLHARCSWVAGISLRSAGHDGD